MEKRKERIDRGIKVRADSIYLLSSWQEILYLLFPRMFLYIFFLLFPVILCANPYWQKVFAITCIYVLLAISFDFLANYAGLVCLGGAFFIGVGGYFSGYLNSCLHLPMYFSIPLATIGGAVFCTLLLIPTLSLRGVYFAIITLMYPMLMTRVIEALNILGGTNGMLNITGFVSVYNELYIISIFTLIFIFALRRINSEDIGILIKAVKDNDQSVRASGINPTNIRIIAVFISSFIGCFAGAFLSHMYMWAGLSLFALDFSIIPIAATVIGGAGSLFGAVIGAIILVPLSEILRDFGALRIVIYSVILTIVIVYKSEGVLNYLSRKYNQTERWVEIK
jgi:branched-chain amino acid transport system permease protein